MSSTHLSRWLVLASTLIILTYPSAGIETGDLFRYGRDAGDDSLHAGTDGSAEDVSTEEIPLDTNVKFFAREYGAIYVSCYDS